MGRCNLAILLVVVLLTANVLIGCAGASKESAEFHYNKGKDLVEQRNCNEAVQEFDEAIRLNPEYAEAYLNRGCAYDIMGQYPRAIDDYNMAISLNPNYDAAYLNRGFAYKLLGKKAEAISDFEKCITISHKAVLKDEAKLQIKGLSE